MTFLRGVAFPICSTLKQRCVLEDNQDTLLFLTLFPPQETMLYRIPDWNRNFPSPLDQELHRWIRCRPPPPVEIGALKSRCLLFQVCSDCLSMCACVCRSCSKTLSTLAWDIKECEARPMTTCWMNLWRPCQRGKMLLALSSLCAHRLPAVCWWHVNGDSTWCSWEKKMLSSLA